MLIEDWNAKVGSINDGWEAMPTMPDTIVQPLGRHIASYGYGKCNDREEALLEFALDNCVVICNTLFQQKEYRKWTWWSPNQHTANMINLILINRKWRTAIQQCRTYRGADIESEAYNM